MANNLNVANNLNNNLNNPLHARNSFHHRSALYTGVVEILLGGMEARLGSAREDEDMKKAGLKTIQTGVEGLCTAIGSRDMAWKDMSEQREHIGTHVIRLQAKGAWRLIWERVINFGCHAWVTHIQPRALGVWVQVQQWGWVG